MAKAVGFRPARRRCRRRPYICGNAASDRPGQIAPPRSGESGLREANIATITGPTPRYVGNHAQYTGRPHSAIQARDNICGVRVVPHSGLWYNAHVP